MTVGDIRGVGTETDLVGLAVVHRNHGPGLIVGDHGGLVSVLFGTELSALPEPRSRLEAEVREYLRALGRGSRLRITADRTSVLDSSAWRRCPDPVEMNRLLEGIGELTTSTLLPSGPPPDVPAVRAEMVRAHRAYLAAQTELTNRHPVGVAHQIATIADWQLGHLLMGGGGGQNDPPLDARPLLSRLGRDAWEELAFPAAPEESRNTVVARIGVVAGLLSASTRSELPDAVARIAAAIEHRMGRHERAALGFVRRRRRTGRR